MRNLVALCGAALLLAGCVTHIQPTVSFNPPPKRALADFEQFEVRSVAAGGGVGEAAAMVKIQQNFDQRVGALIAQWEKPEGDTLVIEPTVRELKFVGGNARFWAGSLAGSSAVRMTVRFIDKATGDVIAEPEFYQRAQAVGGAWSVGGTDNAMLVRITSVVREYLENNYAKPVGGPTGLGESSP